jgi:hypothetical protein
MRNRYHLLFLVVLPIFSNKKGGISLPAIGASDEA